MASRFVPIECAIEEFIQKQANKNTQNMFAKKCIYPPEIMVSKFHLPKKCIPKVLTPSPSPGHNKLLVPKINKKCRDKS
jgi:hypothetical protein